MSNKVRVEHQPVDETGQIYNPGLRHFFQVIMVVNAEVLPPATSNHDAAVAQDSQG